MSWTIHKRDDDGQVLIGGRIVVARRAILEMTPGLSDGSQVVLKIAFDPELMKVVCDTITVTRPAEGSEVTTKFLREVKIHNAVINVAMNSMISVIGKNGLVSDAAKVFDNFKPAKGRDRSEVVADAAIIYTIARLADWPPLKTVADQLSVSQSTATRLVAEARKRDLLDSLESLEVAAMSPAEIDSYLQKPRKSLNADD